MRPTALVLFLAAAAAAPLAAQEAPRVHDLSEVEAPPVVQNVDALREALAAGYPPALRDAGVGGTVTVAFVVGADGAVREPEVVDAPHEALGAATVEAVRVLRFAPATLGGAPVDVRVTLPVQWQVAAPPAPKEPVAAVEPAAADAQPHEALQKLLADDPTLAPLARDAVELRAVEEPPRPRNAQAMMHAMAREYPAALRDTGVRGRTVVRFVVDVTGRPRLGHVKEMTDHRFAEPTLRALQVLRFHPGRLNGVPVPVWVELPVEWSVSAAPPGTPWDPAFPETSNPGQGPRQPPRSLP